MFPVTDKMQKQGLKKKKIPPPPPQNKKHWPFLWPLHSKCKNKFNKYWSFLWHLPIGNQNYILYVGFSCDLYIQKEEGGCEGEDFTFQTVGLSCDL